MSHFIIVQANEFTDILHIHNTNVKGKDKVMLYSLRSRESERRMKLWFENWSKTISKEKRKDIIRNPNGDFCVVQNIISFMKREICWIYWTLSSNFEICYLNPLFQGVVANFWFLWSLVRSQWFGVFYNIYLFIIKMIQLLNPYSGFWGFGIYDCISKKC